MLGRRPPGLRAFPHPPLAMRLTLLSALAAVALAAPASAQVSFVPMVGYDIDYEAAMIGLGFEFALPQNAVPLTVAVRPSVEYLFLGDGSDLGIDQSVFRVNGDLIGRFGQSGRALSPYAKAGLALEVASFDTGTVSDTNTEVGLNLGAGAEYNRFLGEVTLGIGDISSTRIAVGYRF